jgi:hypothetical protein
MISTYPLNACPQVNTTVPVALTVYEHARASAGVLLSKQNAATVVPCACAAAVTVRLVTAITVWT